MTYAYIRVSTDRQTVENQRYEIDNFCRARRLSIDRYIEETVSGMKDIHRRELGTLIRRMRSGDTLIASEISRFGRRLLEVMSILKLLMDKKVNVITVKEHFELGDNLQSHVIAFAFSLAAEIERALISQRTREALARRRALGQKLGRKPGGTNARHKLDRHADLIRSLAAQGCTKAEICRRLHCSYTTLTAHLRRHGLTLSPVRRIPADSLPTPPTRRHRRKVIVLREREEDAPRRHLLYGQEQEIVRMLRKGYSKAYIARWLGCNIKTLDAQLRRMGVKVVKG